MTDCNFFFQIKNRTLKLDGLADCLVVDTFEAALELLNSSKYRENIEKIISIGGSSVYETSMKASCFKTLYLTRVFGHFECDIFLQPQNFLNNFKKLANSELVEQTNQYKCDYNVQKQDSNTGIEYIFEVYEKVF